MVYRFNPFTGDIDDAGKNTGWAQYQDTAYTTASPFDVLDGNTETLPNNALTSITTYLPNGITALYDAGAQKITPVKVGDYNIVTVRFNARSSHSDTYLEFGINIGGAIGLIFRDTKVFPKGSGVDHPMSFACPGYSLSTFIANGGIVKVTAGNGDVEIFDIEYQIARVIPA